MFTYTVDTAINRFTHNGIEYAVAYDDYAENPLEMMGESWLAITRRGRHSTSFDPKGLFNYIEGCREDIERLIMAMEDAVSDLGGGEWWNHLDATTAAYMVALMDDIDYQVAELKGIGTYECGEFTCIYEKSTPESEYVESYVEEYARWANGEVYTIGVTLPNGEEDMVSGFFLNNPYDHNEVMASVRDCF